MKSLNNFAGYVSVRNPPREQNGLHFHSWTQPLQYAIFPTFCPPTLYCQSLNHRNDIMFLYVLVQDETFPFLLLPQSVPLQSLFSICMTLISPFHINPGYYEA